MNACTMEYYNNIPRTKQLMGKVLGEEEVEERVADGGGGDEDE